MTEYGRGPGPEPWHPEDPLYGDGGWGGQAGQQAPQDPYGQTGQHQQYPQQAQQSATQQYAADWGTGQQPGYGQGQQQYDPYQQQSYGDGGWGTGAQPQVPYGGGVPADPYGQQPGYGAQQPGAGDPYGNQGGYPQPQPVQQQPAPQPQQPPQPARPARDADPETGWDPGPDQGEQAFFSSDDDEDEDRPPSRGRGRRRGRVGLERRGKSDGLEKRKRRGGCACLAVFLVLGGGVGGIGYWGYTFYQDHFGPAPDYSGEGTAESISVTIPKGAGGYQIGQVLKDAGVVKSVDAFVEAQNANPEGKKLQAGAYLLKKEMSAESAVALMLDPKSKAGLTVREGERNVAVYADIDKTLGVAKGTTAKVARAKYDSLGLPKWANSNEDIKDPLEGFLFPATYPAAKGMKPEEVLKQMVAQANKKFEEYDVAGKAGKLGLDSPLEVVTVASLVQAEGKTHDDFRKMAEVVYNRLKPTNMETMQKLQFDSTFNYLKGQSNIHVSESEINNNHDPYNTYTNKGLPPGPIGNPGDDAFKAVSDPTHDGWIYFVATDGMNNTEFAKTYDDFLKIKAKFNAS